MADGFWIAIAIILLVAVYTAVKVIANVRKSEQQWREVDRSKLRQWTDDEDR